MVPRGRPLYRFGPNMAERTFGQSPNAAEHFSCFNHALAAMWGYSKPTTIRRRCPPLVLPIVWTGATIRSRGSTILIIMTLLLGLLLPCYTPYYMDHTFDDEDQDAGTKSVKDADEAGDQNRDAEEREGEGKGGEHEAKKQKRRGRGLGE